ncbi:uncharacterized protein LOC111695624 [Eurytemora carolleeae]|uniref:uncharacterized protein LOC111695624 n=1 Tax=Eurytemora carolleeae TaxID=1294199 RepID=UPI000C76DB84|nr:uncharacterized protein LOC111695624 [Eurytemora carolleeae]|eukprot:XP_023320774.1 uncharacterized protein LOC111695624 [Eurytemora affinis]
MAANEAEENVKIKTTGLGAIFNYIQENKDTLAKETKPDPNSSWKNVPLDLLCDVGHGIPKSRKSQRPSAFFCDVCQIDLNSQVTYDTHVAGIKHQKKARNLNHLEKGLGEASLKPQIKKNKGVSSTNIKVRILFLWECLRKCK